MKRSAGFTVIEIIIVILFLGLATTLLLTQRAELRSTTDDNNRKIAINAMYYNLEEVFYKQHGYYPATISSATLTAMDPALFTDPNGVKLGESDSDYRYESTDCSADKCKSYSLRALLEKEDDYVKTSRNN